MILISESQDECLFMLDSGIRFRVSPVDKMFVVRAKWLGHGQPEPSKPEAA